MKKKKQKPANDKTTIDMPEVKDIPGQEHVRPPRMREMEDTTASSAGEEGEGLLDDLNKEDEGEENIMNSNTDVTEEEKELLEQSDRPVTEETKDLQKLALDSIDEDEQGSPNEEANPLDMGEDLDVPGSELDDENEEIGEEDEENNLYS